MSGACPPHHRCPDRRRCFCGGCWFVRGRSSSVRSTLRGGLVQPASPPSRWWLLVCCGNSFPPAVQASSRFPNLSPSSSGSPSIAGPQGSCGGAASSPLGGWWRFWVLPDSGRLPPRRRVGVFESWGFSLRNQCCSLLVLVSKPMRVFRGRCS